MHYVACGNIVGRGGKGVTAENQTLTAYFGVIFTIVGIVATLWVGWGPTVESSEWQDF